MAAEDFKIDTQPIDKGVILVTINGYLDAHTFERLEQTIAELFNKNQYNMVVDLSGVEYISSAGAGVFIHALNESHEHKGNIVLMKPTPNVREVFDLLGLTLFFQIVDDKAAAMGHFA
jgi:anti-sigma B factor antagonist